MFKKGDKIRRISNREIFTVKGVYGELEYDKRNFSDAEKGVLLDNDWWDYKDNFELVEEKCEGRVDVFKQIYSDFIPVSKNFWGKSLLDCRVQGSWENQVYKPKKTIMSKITTFAKNLVLSADEKLLRKFGLKNECGEYTSDARELVIEKLIADNQAYLIDTAKALEVEEKNK